MNGTTKVGTARTRCSSPPSWRHRYSATGSAFAARSEPSSGTSTRNVASLSAVSWLWETSSLGVVMAFCTPCFLYLPLLTSRTYQLPYHRATPSCGDERNSPSHHDNDP